MTASAGPALKRLYRDFGDRVSFATLYVREAHPGERFPQPETFEQKRAHARAYRDRDAIPWPVAVDSVDGDLHRALDSKPNFVYLIGIDGRVAFPALWSNDEATLRWALRTLLAKGDRLIGQRERRMIRMLRGMGKMHEILEVAGQQAKRDVRRAVRPIYGMARLAAAFRPLPPGARAGAAIGTTLVGFALLTMLSWRWLGGASRARASVLTAPPGQAAGGR